MGHPASPRIPVDVVRPRGYLATIAAVAAGTLLGAISSAFVGLFLGLLAVFAVASVLHPGSNRFTGPHDANLAINIAAAIIAVPVTAATTGLSTFVIIEVPRTDWTRTRHNYAATRATVWAATITNAAAVLICSIVLPFLFPNGLAVVICAPWSWPLSFIGVGIIARTIALRWTGRAQA
jgi:hypothetical protein